MSFLGNFRADQQITQLMSEADPTSKNALNLVERLKRAGPKAIPKLIDALALSDKSHTMMFVDILTALVNDKTLSQFKEGLADGNERVVKGTAWALSGSTDFNPNGLLEFFDDREVHLSRRSANHTTHVGGGSDVEKCTEPGRTAEKSRPESHSETHRCTCPV